TLVVGFSMLIILVKSIGVPMITASQSALLIVSSRSFNCCSPYPIAGSTVSICGYFSKVSVSDPTVYGSGLTISLTPIRSAAMIPAPIFISPCVNVGPSSTTSTRLFFINSGLSTVIVDSDLIIVLSGFACLILSSTIWIDFSSALSILLMMATSVVLRHTSPG